MSELTVGQLRGLPVNNNIVTVPSGHTLYAPGHVIQVVSATKNDVFSTTSGTFGDISGLVVTITLKNSSSKILISATVTGMTTSTTNTQRAGFVIARNSSILTAAQGTGLPSDRIYAGQLGQTGLGSPNFTFNSSINHLDSPNSTSALTYSLQARTGGGTLFINKDPANEAYSTSSITVMEIAQ
jgi:hypothetical protein